MVNQPPSRRGAGGGMYPRDMDEREVGQKIYVLTRQVEELQRHSDAQLRSLAAQIEEIKSTHQEEIKIAQSMANKEALLRDLLNIQNELYENHESLRQLVAHTYQFQQKIQDDLDKIYANSPSFSKVHWYNWAMVAVVSLMVLVTALNIVIQRNNPQPSSLRELCSELCPKRL